VGEGKAWKAKSVSPFVAARNSAHPPSEVCGVERRLSQMCGFNEKGGTEGKYPLNVGGSGASPARMKLRGEYVGCVWSISLKKGDSFSKRVSDS